MGGLVLLQGVQRDLLQAREHTVLDGNAEFILQHQSREGNGAIDLDPALPWVDRKRFNLVARFETAV
jgi:hypothetical protein